MANKLLSHVEIGGITYDLKDAESRQNIETLIGSHAIQALGAAAWEAVAAEVSDSETGVPSVAAVKSYIDSAVGKVHNFDVVIDTNGTEAGPSVTATADTMYKIYLVPDANAEAGSYIEYITIKNSDTYSWEAIGSTKTSLEGYVEKTQKIAGLTLNKDITVEALQGALGLKAFAYAAKGTATVTAKTVQSVKATGTSTGSLTGDVAYTATAIESTGKVKATGSITGSAISGGSIAVTLKDAEAATAASVTAEAYKPAGSVSTTFTAAAEGAEGAVSFGGTVSKPTATVTPVTTSVRGVKTTGTAYSLTDSTVTKAEDTASKFVKKGMSYAVNEDSETLTLGYVTNTDTEFYGDAVTSVGAVTYTAPTLSGELPTFEDAATVMTGVDVDVSQPTFTGNKYTVNSSFSGTEEENMKVTGVTYVKQAVNTATFTPTTATLGFEGDNVDVSVSGSYDKANKGTLAFAGTEISLNVGDIVVPGETIDVTPVSE